MEVIIIRAMRKSKSEWLEIIKKQKESELSEKNFCEAENINRKTLQNKKYQFKKEAESEAAQISWTQVVCEGKSEKESIKINVGKFNVIVAENFNDKTLEKVCEVLEKIC